MLAWMRGPRRRLASALPGESVSDGRPRPHPTFISSYLTRIGVPRIKELDINLGD
jgi:hypothetical protein